MLVREGGWTGMEIIYAIFYTIGIALLCSQYEDVICEFVKAHHEFEFVKIEIPGPLMRDNSGYITFYPNIDNTDGFFISKIKRVK